MAGAVASVLAMVTAARGASSCGGAGPPGTPFLRIGPRPTFTLAWSSLPGSTSHDVVRGDLQALGSTGGDFAAAGVSCLANDRTTAFVNDPSLPFQATWYLVRSSNDTAPGTFDTDSPRQVRSRDPGIANAPSSCAPRCIAEDCGDGVVSMSEQCDDGNRVAADGCDTACAFEVGWFCDGSPSRCVNLCGDGLVVGPEECDDANGAASDGCTPGCSVEAGWTCSGSPSVCTSSPLVVTSIMIPPVTAVYDPPTQSCVFTVSNARADLRNLVTPPPYDDIVLETVEISYAWDAPGLEIPPRVFSISGFVPAGGTSTVSFVPIAPGDLTPGHAGHTAALTLVFSGHKVSGGSVEATAPGALGVDSCGPGE